MIDWRAPDWPVPADVWSFRGSPFAVVSHVAEAVGAVVEADRTQLAVRVSSRYETMPNEWGTTAPDVQIAWHAVESENTGRRDQPPYSGVVLAGQQGGALGLVRLAGTSGADAAPMLTHPLLTDVDALRERGRTELGASGRARHITRSLPILNGSGEPGVLRRGQLVRWVDPDATWSGVVRAVRIEAELGKARQHVTCERRDSYPAGATGQAPIDPHIADVVLLINAVYDGGTAIVDQSSKARAPQQVGSFTMSSYAGGALAAPGGAPLMYAADADFDLSTGDWTIEIEAYETSSSVWSLLSRRPPTLPAGWVLHASGMRAKINGAWDDLQINWTHTSGLPSRDAWHYYCFERFGSTITGYVDGVVRGQKTGVVTIDDQPLPLTFGQADTGSENRFDGYMRRIRFTRAARYRGAPYTPVSAPFPTR